jgi:D-alanyl-D-alanine carboxypeptidase
MKALQKGLVGAHGAKTNAVLAIRDPACGSMFVASGPGDVQASDLHRIGSVTKTYVTGVIMGLVNDGVLSLDGDRLSKWVTTIPNASAITIRELLSHTGGVFNYTDDMTWEAAVAADPTRVWAPSDLVAVAARNTPYFAPGQGWTYSNTDFILLGMIAEAVTGQKIGALVRQRVFEKAMLNATFFAGEEPALGTLAKGYDATGKDVTNYADPSYAWAAGAMVATPADVALWIEELGNGTFYDAATQAEIVMPAPMSSQGGGSYGLGLEMLSAAATGIGPAYGHGGDIAGYHTQAFYFPEKKTTIVAIVDSDADDPNNVSIVALDALFGG